MNTYLIKDKIDNIIYYCFNLLSDFVYFFNFKVKRIVKENVKYKNIHSNERCFILGTGPSLNKITDNQILKLKSEVIIGVNSLYKAKISNEITPKYYALFDNLYWNEEKYFFKEILKKYKNEPPIFLTDYRAKEILDELQYRSKALMIYAKRFPVNKINHNLTGNMYIGQNVINSAILFCSYMGFKEIYLLGCDYNSFATVNPEHCYDDKEEMVYNTENLSFYLKFYALTTRIHYLISKFTSKNSIKVINLTPNSLLDAYKKDNLDNILNIK